MSLTARPGASIEPIENGNHHGICVAVIDLGTQYEFEKSTPKVMVIWELPDFPRSDSNGFREIHKEYSTSLHELSNLYQDLVSWRGRDFTVEELEGFNMKNVLGANCLVNVIQEASKKTNRIYAKVKTVAKLPKSMANLVATYQLLYDMDEDVMPIPEGIPDWIKDKIKKSAEYIADSTGQAPPDPSDGQVPVDDEDIPF